MTRVLVLDANQRSALATTRSLGNHRISVITADETSSALAGCSRYSEKYITYPSPKHEPSTFASYIANLCVQLDVNIILPMTELTTTILLNCQRNLNLPIIPVAKIDNIETLANKCTLIALAQEISVPVPKTWFVDNSSRLPVDIGSLHYPVVLKPCKSWIELNGEWHHTKVRVADNPSQVTEILNTDPWFDGRSFMLQEYIPGKGAGVFALYDSGELMMSFAHRRLREKPPRGGVSVYSESVPVDPILESFSRKLLDHVAWHGVAMVEFRVTPEGKPYLMEVNTRPWGSLQLAVDAGVDFPWMLYRLATDEKTEPVTEYKTGTRLRWLLGDLDHLYLVLRDPTFSLIEKTKAMIAFLTPHPFKTRHEVNRWNDLNPFWWELKQYVRDLVE